MSMGSPALPRMPEVPPAPDPAKEAAALDLKASQAALAEMRASAQRRGRASTILAGNMKDATLGSGTIFGGGA